MSFLNPINEPVLMYSSTDANAPKINYAARAAGDVKTVLKACLVTGYGTKQGAGWTMQNETDFAADFVSPSAMMSDYAFSVSDNSTTATTFTYKFQSVTQTPANNTLTKSLGYVQLNSPNNAWILLVTKQGFLWIEKFKNNNYAFESCRILYWGRVKSALLDDAGKNICFYSFGCNGGQTSTSAFFSGEQQYLILGSYTTSVKNCPILEPLKTANANRAALAVELSGGVYLSSAGLPLAEMLPITMTKMNDKAQLFGVRQTTFNSRPALYICIGSSFNYSSQDAYAGVCEGCYVYLDNWGY